MKKIIIYEYQLKLIEHALRMTSNIHKSSDGITSFDRVVRNAWGFSQNALAESDTE